MYVFLSFINGILAAVLAAFLFGYLHQRYPDYGLLRHDTRLLAGLCGGLAALAGMITLFPPVNILVWALWLPVTVIVAPLLPLALHGFTVVVSWCGHKITSFGENLGARARDEHDEDQAH